MVRTYVHSILTLYRSGTPIEDVLRGVREILLKKGQRTLYKKILKQALIALEREERAKTPHIIRAVETEILSQEQDIAATLSHVESVGTPTKTVDQSLIGGYVAIVHNTMIDKSYKRKLLSIYTSLTK